MFRDAGLCPTLQLSPFRLRSVTQHFWAGNISQFPSFYHRTACLNMNCYLIVDGQLYIEALIAPRGSGQMSIQSHLFNLGIFMYKAINIKCR